MKEVKKEIDNFVNERDWEQFHTPKNLAASITIEAAELLECFQWSNPSKIELIQDQERMDSVKAELADVMIYTIRLCSILSLDPLKIIRDKLEENREKYPISLSRGTPKKYNEL